MGRYKVFNGTDWVDICDCQVHIRNASDNWQLLDPNNCVTKYWTGTEWCEIVCACVCQPGYTLNPLTGICEQVIRIAATASGGTFYPIIGGNKFTTFNDYGARLYQNITGFMYPINAYNGLGTYLVKDNAGNGALLTNTVSVPTNQIFNSQGTTTKGRLNYAGIWGQGYSDNELFTVRFCVTISEAKTYIFALAGDNEVYARITSDTFNGGVTSLPLINLWDSASPTGLPKLVGSQGYPFRYWHMFPIDLPIGDHVFELSGLNFGVYYGFAAEVYDISIAQLQTFMNSTTATPADFEPYVIFTTKNLIQSPPLLLPAPGETGITYTCPDGYTYTDCYGSPQCIIDNSYPCGGGCSCPDGVVVIGTQTWTCKNLDVTTYRNGDIIPEVSDQTTWENLTTGAWCYYNNDPANDAIYGKLYNWYAVNDPRGLAPTGYHVPTDAEWTVLTGYLGGPSVAGGKMKEVGASWNSPNTDATNSSCFTGLPGGARNSGGDYYYIGNYGEWWSSTENYTNYAWSRGLNSSSGSAGRGYSSEKTGLSVRLVKD